MILDLGGANGNLYDMGYPYPFRQLTVVDLPSHERCEMYRGITIHDLQLPHGRVSILYANMTDLSSIADDSIDLIWMGQAMEHITEEESFRVYQQAKRVLQPEGYFCLDTPNRNLTGIHTGGGWSGPQN